MSCACDTMVERATHMSAARLEDSFQRLLLSLCDAGACGGPLEAFVENFCRSTRDFFQASGAYCWAVSGDGLLGLGGDGVFADQVSGTQFSIEENTFLADAIRTRHVDLQSQVRLPKLSGQTLAAAMTAPIIVGGDLIGVVAYVHETEPSFFDDDHVSAATVLATLLGSYMTLLQRNAAASQRAQESQQFIQFALELTSSLRLPDLVRKFTERSAAMIGAPAAALVLAGANRFELVVLQNSITPEKAVLHHFLHVLREFVSGCADDIIHASADQLLGANLAQQLQWKDLTLVRLSASDGELLGLLCLADIGTRLSGDELVLIRAIAGHGSVALENTRLFTRMEQASRHWVEIFDSITDLIVVHDEHDSVLRVNRSMADLTGLRPQALIGLGMDALISLTGGGASGCPFCRMADQNSDEYVHSKLERTYLVSTSRIHGAANEGMQTIHVLKDTTDRREAERRYRELFDNIQEGLFFSTPEGRFVEVNDALVRILGYSSREEVLQIHIPSQVYLAPDQRHRLEQAMETDGVLRNFEEVLRRKDGSLIHALQNAFAVRDASGRVVQYRGLMLDITELKNFQAELQRERDFSSKILNNTQSLIVVVDTAGLVSYGNRRCYEPKYFKNEDLLGRRLESLFPPPRREAIAAAMEATLDGCQVDNLELPVVLAGDRLGQFSINLSPMRDEQGNVTSVVVVMTDITETSLLQAKLMHTEKMAAVGQLVSGVAHEVNNPLTAVLGFTDLLLEQPDVPDSAKNDLRIILQEGQRTKEIVQNLLSFARQTPPNRDAVQVNAAIRKTLALRAYDFTSHNIELVENLNESIPEIVGDAHQLQQVFLNVLNNAYDAVGEVDHRGRIEVTTSLAGNLVEIRFTDNGSGVSYPEKIFDPFFTTKEVGKGTGLGLSICYGIVHEHGGEITCQNNPAGGATFTIRLPITAERTKTSATSNGGPD